MLKQISDISEGDWVLLESLVQNRHVSRPWKVTSVVKSRVYLCQFREDPRQKGFCEVSAEKYVQRSSIKYVFSEEQSAQELSMFARASGDECMEAIRRAEAECLARFSERVATLSAKKLEN